MHRLHRQRVLASSRHDPYHDNRLRQGYTVSEALDAAPGEVVSETTHATTYMGATAETFEGERIPT